MSRVLIVEDSNNEVIEGDDVFQMDELVNPYRVAPSIKLENPNFHVIENTYIEVDVDVDELNVISSNKANREADDEINHDFNKEDDVVYDDDENVEKVLIKKSWIVLIVIFHCVTKLKIYKIFVGAL